ncbi:MAG: hypothetical protein ACKVU4_05500 [Phycisphaerales bacterium]
MDFLAHLWLPILLSAAAVWVAGAIVWMALPHHKGDFARLPDEDGFRAFVRTSAIPAGSYGFPDFGSHADANSPEGKKKFAEGPVGTIIVWGKISMGRNMLITFLVHLVVSALIGYVGWAALPHGPPTLGPGGGVAGSTFAHVFQVLGTVGVLAYSFAFIPNGVWFGQRSRAIVMCILDGVVYGLITGAVFAAMWPTA